MVAEFFPWPATSGGHMRTANTVEALAELGEVDMFAFHDRRKPEPVLPATAPVSSLVSTGYPMARRLGWRLQWLLERGVPIQIASRLADAGPRD